MVLRDVLANVEKYEARLVVYVAGDQEPGPGSLVELVNYVGPTTQEPAGKRYLLSIGDIRDVLETWSKWRDGCVPNDEERCEAVAFYAKHDGYLPIAG